MIKLFIKSLLFFMAYNLYAGDMIDGSYKFRSTVKESTSNETYSFKMNLYIDNNNITGDIDYPQYNCSGTISGQMLSNTKLKLSDNISEGKDICNNGTYLYHLEHQIISKASSYTLDGEKHNVIINKYDFTPNTEIWNNVILKKDINQTKIDIEELKNQMIEPRKLIEEAERKKDQAQYHLDNNHTNFIDGQCTIPPLAEPKPDPFFDTEEKANHYALAYCSVPFSCKLGVELAKNNLKTKAKIFLASQSCTLLVKDFIRKGTLLDETMVNLLDSVSYEGCNDESNDIFSTILQGGSCVMSGAVKIVRIEKYLHCIRSKTKKFHNTYLDWKNKPTKEKVACEKDLKIVNETPKIVEKYNEEIINIKDKIVVKNKQLQQFKNGLTEVLLIRKKQSELIKQLQH